MTKSADQLLHIQDTFQKTAAFHEQIFQEDRFGNGYVHMIPLFESVDDLSHCEEVIRDYLNKHQQKWGSLPPYLRVFIARSDPALNAGLVPAVLASRLALNQTRKIQDQFQIPIHPIIGSGSLPFRGGINPENLDHVLPQYAGAKTLTIQSAFRFDYATEEVTAALKTIQEKLPTLNAPVLEEKEIGLLRGLIETFKNTYRPTLEKMAPAINAMAKFIPQRRERVQHIGLFGYNRGVGEVKLPRAITFTGACYSMGIPPEFIGTGRALKTAEEQGLLPLLEKHFFTLRSELKHAGKYLNLENLLKAAEKHDWAKELIQDVELCQKILQIDLGPSKPHHHLHRNLTSTIRLKNEMDLDFNTDLVEAAVMRKSLG